MVVECTIEEMLRLGIEIPTPEVMLRRAVRRYKEAVDDLEAFYSAGCGHVTIEESPASYHERRRRVEEMLRQMEKKAHDEMLSFGNPKVVADQLPTDADIDALVRAIAEAPVPQEGRYVFINGRWVAVPPP